MPNHFEAENKHHDWSLRGRLPLSGPVLGWLKFIWAILGHNAYSARTEQASELDLAQIGKGPFGLSSHGIKISKKLECYVLTA